MLAAPLPLNEEQRLQELRSYNILDTAEEDDYNHLVQLASLICGTHLSVINFIDLTRQWGKAMKGLDNTEAPREISLCAHTILQDDVLQIEDTLLDERFHDNPFTTEGGIRFYAGAPIVSKNGYNIGSLCVCDTRPMKLDQRQTEALKQLSRQAAILLEVRKQNRELQEFAREEKRLKEKAEQAKKEQEQFLSTMSHEIRTPLNGIIGMVNILQNECPKPEQRDYIDTLQFAAKNLLSVVNDVLDFNKIAAGKISLEEVEFNLPKLVQDIRKAHLPNANAKGISLVVDMAAGIPERVKADPTRLTQILNNLVGNAVKFTLQGCVTIRLKSCQNTGEKIAVLFNVEDTGIGISEDQKAVIFEQFSQANESITRQFGGTGLGLTITKQLLQLMGSSINVHSKPGEGSCFSFELPMAAAAATACHQTEITARKHFNHLRILLAEDNAINILVTKKMLQKVGATIDVAHNGQEVVDMVSSTAYDVILMDMQMPVMDGIATVKVLRQEKQFTGPVVLLTADAFINHHKDVCAAGFSDYLLKPFGAEELYQKLEVLTNPSFA